MEFWLDSVDFPSIKEIESLGILYGITTNPQILSKSSISPIKTIKKLLDLQQGPLAVQVTELTSGGMISQGLKLAKISKKIVIKVPACLEGYKAMKAFKQKGLTVMATVIFDSFQALHSLNVGADYLAFYIGRMEDEGIKAFEVISTIQKSIKSTFPKVKLLGASLRSPHHIMKCLELDMTSITINESLFLSTVTELTIVKKNRLEFSQNIPKNWI